MNSFAVLVCIYVLAFFLYGYAIYPWTKKPSWMRFLVNAGVAFVSTAQFAVVPDRIWKIQHGTACPRVLTIVTVLVSVAFFALGFKLRKSQVTRA